VTEFDVVGRPTALIALAWQSRCLARGAELVTCAAAAKPLQVHTICRVR